MNDIQKQKYHKVRESRDTSYDGRLYTAVKSTKIYCRPSCAAKQPLEKNVLYFIEQEQAVKAGFRPCLKCKPQYSPYNNGKQDCVSNLLRYIRSGYLLNFPNSKIEEIFGISLDNLNDQLIASGYLKINELVEINRVLFASKFLHNSNLSLEDIVLGCGYRNLNDLKEYTSRYLHINIDNFKNKQFQSSDENISYFLYYPYPYDCDYALDFKNRRLLNGIEYIKQSQYMRHITINNKSGFFSINKVKNGFDVTVSKTLLDQILIINSAIINMFDLSTNKVEIYNLLKEKYPSLKINDGLHIMGYFSAFETGIRAICGQQISITAAVNLVNVIIKQVELNKSRSLQDFPAPEDFQENIIESIKTTMAKKRAFINFAYWCASNKLINENVDDLLAIKGIGKWTVEYIKLRAFNHTDIWMETDLGIKKKLDELKLGDVDKIAPWRSYLTSQIWES